MKVEEPIVDIINQLFTAKEQVLLGDTYQVLKSIESKKFDLIITSPPYNIGKEYETKQSIEKYLEKQQEVISELVRVLSEQGSICWQVGNYVEKGEVFPLDIYYFVSYIHL